MRWTGDRRRSARRRAVGVIAGLLGVALAVVACSADRPRESARGSKTLGRVPSRMDAGRAAPHSAPDASRVGAVGADGTKAVAAPRELPVGFPSGDGFVLNGTLALPAAAPGVANRLPGFVLVHGSGAHGRDVEIGRFSVFRELSQRLVARGAAVLRYDKRNFTVKAQLAKIGPAAAKAKFRRMVPRDFIADAQAAFDFLRRRPEVDPADITLVGHSQGGSFAPYIAQKRPFARVVLLAPGVQRLLAGVRYQGAFQIGLITKSGAARTEAGKAAIAQIRRNVAAFDKVFRRVGNRKVPDDAWVGFGATKRFFRQWDDLLAGFEAALAALKRPTLIIQGETDKLCVAKVLRRKARRFQRNPAVRIVFVPRMGHLLHDDRTGTFAPQVIQAIWKHRSAQ